MSDTYLLGHDEAEIQRLQSRTNATGKTAFQFPLPPALVGRPQDVDDARIQLEVSVTDPAGQKQTRTASCLVTTQPLRIEVIPEAGTPVADVPNTIYVYVSTADGRGGACNLQHLSPATLRLSRPLQRPP